MLTLLEFLAFVTTLRFFWRLLCMLCGRPTGGAWRNTVPRNIFARIASPRGRRAAA